jgi:hypothetical protein
LLSQGGIKKAIACLIPFILVGGIFSCGGRDPFFPSSGAYVGVPMRSTPQGLITQFENAYQDISLSLYQNLLPTDGSFEFFVAPGFVPENPVSLDVETRDTTLQFIGNSTYYYYWTQDIELKSEYALFQNALSMQFITPISIEQSRPIFDSLGDTTNYEVEMTGELYISFNNPDAYPDQDILISCDFLLARDSKNLWVIKKWYDLQSSS